MTKFPIILSRQQQKQAEEKEQRELAEYKKKIMGIANDIIGDMIDDGLTVDDFNNIVNVIQMRFNKSFKEGEIKSLIKEKTA